MHAHEPGMACSAPLACHPAGRGQRQHCASGQPAAVRTHQPRFALLSTPGPDAGSCTKSDLSISAPLFRNLTGRDPGASPSIAVRVCILQQRC